MWFCGWSCGKIWFMEWVRSGLEATTLIIHWGSCCTNELKRASAVLRSFKQGVGSIWDTMVMVMLKSLSCYCHHNLSPKSIISFQQNTNAHSRFLNYFYWNPASMGQNYYEMTNNAFFICSFLNSDVDITPFWKKKL